MKRTKQVRLSQRFDWEKIARDALVVSYLFGETDSDPFGTNPWPGWARDLREQIGARKRNAAKVEAMSPAQRRKRLSMQRKALEKNEKRARNLHEVRRYVDGIGPRPAALDAPAGSYEKLKRYEKEYRAQKEQVEIDYFRDHGNTWVT